MDNIELKNVKGSFDYLPKEQIIRDYIQKTLKVTFEKYGYMPVDTPTLCYFDVLASKYGAGAEILKEVYHLEDQGNRELALRYDLTVPFARLIAMTKDITLPFKRYEIGKVYRDGPVKAGRNREFMQCDADVVGVKDMMVDAEFINLFVDGFKNLGIDAYVEYNNRKLMTGLIIELGIEEEKIVDVITVLDKFKKMSKAELKAEFAKIGLSEEITNELLSTFAMSYEELKNKFGAIIEIAQENEVANAEQSKETAKVKNQMLAEGFKELEELNEYIKTLNLKEDVVLNPTLARGHDIYTGTVFEVFVKDGSIKSSFGGGGRYDKIITNFIDDGKEYPACGISFGLEPIYEYLKNTDKFKNINTIQVLIIPMGTKKESLSLAKKMRDLGIKVDLIFNNRKLGKVMNFANKENIPYVVILGEDEITNGIFKVKDMATGENIEVEFNNIEKMVEIVKK